MIAANKSKARESNTAGMARRNRGNRTNLHNNDAFIRRDYHDIREDFENMQDDPFNKALQRLTAISSAENKKRMKVMDCPSARQHDVDYNKPSYNKDLDGI